jgi:hypothetical protein
MAEGNKTYDGLAVPLFGESEIQAQTAATDILTITGAASHTGDYLVLQDSTGTELLYIDSNGVIQKSLSSTALNGLVVNVSSTGAIAAGANVSNAILVDASSKSNFAAIIGYNSGGGSEVGAAEAFFAVHGSKAPNYLISIGATAAGVGASGDNGFLDTNVRYNAAPSTAHVFTGLAMLSGSKTVYVLAAPATLVTVA